MSLAKLFMFYFFPLLFPFLVPPPHPKLLHSEKHCLISFGSRSSPCSYVKFTFYALNS
ncbi:hypothetical protein GLYMA_20G123650v4 [Glycine max]|nr:hypothetical protein GLYMA_20G123650v4 [Glycine max]KAH1035760.1 hypothetical protein GYH30_055641 [Glycine max]